MSLDLYRLADARHNLRNVASLNISKRTNCVNQAAHRPSVVTCYARALLFNCRKRSIPRLRVKSRSPSRCHDLLLRPCWNLGTMRIKRYEFLCSLGRCNCDSRNAIAGPTCKLLPVRTTVCQAICKGCATPANTRGPSNAASGVSSCCTLFTAVSPIVIMVEFEHGTKLHSRTV